MYDDEGQVPKKGIINNRAWRRWWNRHRRITHDWKRTPSRTWKVYGRDDRHQYRRWNGPQTIRGSEQGFWEYGTALDAGGSVLKRYCG